MGSIYSREFAAVYNKYWSAWGAKMWPVLREQMRRRNPGATTWLDLCCGTGSLLEFVVDAGFHATGVDRSRHQLTHARRNVPTAHFVEADIRQVTLGHRYDVVSCLYDSLNYLTRKRDLLRALRRARRHLATGGIFAFDVNTFEGLDAEWCKTTALHKTDCTLILDSSFDRRRALGRCHITGFVRKGQAYSRFDEVHVERGYHPHELDELLARTGLRHVSFDAYRGGRGRKRSQRLLYVAWRA